MRRYAVPAPAEPAAARSPDEEWTVERPSAEVLLDTGPHRVEVNADDAQGCCVFVLRRSGDAGAGGIEHFHHRSSQSFQVRAGLGKHLASGTALDGDPEE